MAWYLKGFTELDDALGQLDEDVPFPTTELGSPRGRQGSPRAKVALPERWLDDPWAVDLELADAELGISGG